MLVYCVLVAVLAFGQVVKADYCENNFTISELPDGLLDEVLSIALTGTIEDFVGCPSNTSVSEDNINLWLWNNDNPNTPLLVDKTNPDIDPTTPLIILIPGWLCNVTNDRMPQLKDAYLKANTDVNIIGIDWSTYSIAPYSDVFCSVPPVADIVSTFVCKLGDLGVDITQLHVVGHSMGGQMSGLIGQQVQTQCGKTIGRISGLDPAGPLYQTLSESQRLSKTDATRVEVIHSNQLQFGFYGACGTVDFFPNCGYFQPGCLKTSINTDPDDLLNLALADVGCNHLRSVDYMIESISSDGFVGTSCALCPGLPLVGPCIEDLVGKTEALMGEPCPSDPPSAKYHLQTNSQSPYAEG